MATTNPISGSMYETDARSAERGLAAGATSGVGSGTAPESSPDLLVMAAAMPAEQLRVLLANLSTSLPEQQLLVAVPEVHSETNGDGDRPLDATQEHPNLRVIVSPTANANWNSSWTLTANDFVNAHLLAQKSNARSVLMLGSEASSMDASSLHLLAHGALAGSADLTLPCYDLPPHAGLVNSAILYPLTRALFAQRARYPLAIDLGLSRRMIERLAAAGQRFTATNQGNALVWPMDEASTAGFSIQEFDVGTRQLPQPAELDLNAVLPLVAGSLFADIEAKAAYWQRVRALPPPRSSHAPSQSTEGRPDITPMIEAFRLGYTNLREVWSLVLPPNSLIGLKRLSVADVSEFVMPDNLWARIVFDFLLAYRQRTINRGHLLGALIPLYLAWVASHIHIVASGTRSERHIEAVAAAFEADKPYLVSRWRWPDRFNP